MTTLSAEDRMIKARVALVRKKPFFGRLAMRLILTEAPGIPTSATDGEKLYYSPEFVSKITDVDVEFLIEHEVMHVVQDAFRRKPMASNPAAWNLACDYVIDTLIKDSGCTSPLLEELRGPKVYALARDKTSEQVYRELVQEEPDCAGCKAGTPIIMDPGQGDGQDGQAPGDGQGQDGQGQGQDGQGSSPGGQGNGHSHGKVYNNGHTCNPKGCTSGVEIDKMTEQIKSQWKQAIVSAAEYARTRGTLPGHIENMLEKVLAPTVNWKDVLRRSAAATFRGRYTWNRPSRRQGPNFSLRRIAREPNPNGAVIMLDTSGSISEKEIIQFVSESVEILRVCKAPWVDLYLHTTECYKVWRITNNGVNDKWEMQRGGTSHIDVFNKVAEAPDKVGMIVAFTDLETVFPDKQPNCEVVWAHPKNHGNKIPVPWGIKVEVDINN